MSSHPSEAAERQIDAEAGTGDAELLERLRARDVNAFAAIVNGWSPGMIRVARSYVSTDASAQEVVQDTWLALVRGLDRSRVGRRCAPGYSPSCAIWRGPGEPGKRVRCCGR
jgi:hypothetical protein